MNERALIAMLALIALVVLTNAFLYGIVRSFSRGDSRWLHSLRSTFSRPLEVSHKPMDDLHKKIEQLGSASQQFPPPDEKIENDRL